MTILPFVCIIIISCCKPLLNYSETFKNNNNGDNNSKMYKIKKSKIHGNGIFATKFIKKDENIGLIFEDIELSNGIKYTITQPNFTSSNELADNHHFAWYVSVSDGDTTIYSEPFSTQTFWSLEGQPRQAICR